MTLPPLLLLDVDGVLNALADYDEHLEVWPDWKSGHATADGTSWPITWAPEVIGQLRTWHESGSVELQWLTTWGHDANGELRELLGLPGLAVAGTYDDGLPAINDPAATSHADVAPAAPDPLTGQWWKYDVVLKVLQEHPERVIIWVDDELHDGTSRFRQWADQHDRVLAVGPDPRSGLASHDVLRIMEIL
ncbi:MAG: HAD domain-containing protein [Actinomycetota bacterium]|nr:HAD domain-containing protein [Actinomycetota bacterium]